MKIVAISIGSECRIEHAGRRIGTGIYKAPVDHPVHVGVDGIEGDVQVDRENHGGPDKAVYAYSADNYGYWQEDLGLESLPYGHFGENLTITGGRDDEVHIGDTFRGGSVRFQVTQPRVPCFKLGVKVGDHTFPKRFLISGRVGFYLRVLEEGELRVGDHLERTAVDPGSVSVREAMLALVKGPRQREVIAKLLSLEALSGAWRESLREKLG
ncbi:MOSC domain protein [Methylococcus capsulatus str. Bath]|uniref:MOSC domain protein n=1 Tax=Methylococcus capsulatus (strain ATCC 33009 / NCIMB 11132 / Bath) TaxID=243233 RepID=Q604U4_METCA|nr:MOSC domain-containing protein [Methylococcus capsulatus]AAU91449.1 MOSC domain protein [Methylococcus capsulatus str. Bath]